MKAIIASVDNDKNVFKAPIMGNKVPKGYKLSQVLFVDNSGFGTEGENALTASQFLKQVKTGNAYTIKEAGQFQVYINEFVKC